MSSQGLVRTPAVAALVALLLTAAGELQHVREQRYPDPIASEDTLYLTSGETLKRLTAGYNVLAADLYWIRALQYFGSVRLRLTAPVHGAVDGAAHGAVHDAVHGDTAGAPADYQLLFPLLDIATTLDPRFNIAYRFGSVFLAEDFPVGAGRPDLAIALLEKGLRARPDKWEYMQDIGFVHYWWRHDYKTAADWFNRAAALPGAPWFLKPLAATTLAEGGDRASSRTMWQSMRDSSDNSWLKDYADRRLLQLRALDEIDELQRRVDRVAATAGRPPTGWAEVLGATPADPLQTPYELDAGRVRVSPSSPLFPMPEEPQHRSIPGS